MVCPGQGLVLPARPQVGQPVLLVLGRAVLDPAEVVSDPGSDHPGVVLAVVVKVVVPDVLPVDWLVVEDVHHAVHAHALDLVLRGGARGFEDDGETTWKQKTIFLCSL